MFSVPADASVPIQEAVPEADFQALVVETALLAGWRVYHTYRSDRSDAGFPDLILVRGRVLLAVELKRVGKAPTMAQVRWLLSLANVREVAAYAWDVTDEDAMRRVLG
jgi:hypothetical protein